jgi:hypothetical protein
MSNLEKVAAKLEQFDVKVSAATGDVTNLESVTHADFGSFHHGIHEKKCQVPSSSSLLVGA